MKPLVPFVYCRHRSINHRAMLSAPREGTWCSLGFKTVTCEDTVCKSPRPVDFIDHFTVSGADLRADIQGPSLQIFFRGLPEDCWSFP
jgi:hypothetical protein